MKKYLLLSLIVLILVGCSFREWTGTSWNVELNLPLMDEKYPIIDLVDDEFIFLDESDSTLYAKSVGEVNTTPIDELIVEVNSAFSIPHLYSTLNEYPGFVPFISILPDYTIEVVFGKILEGSLFIDLIDIVDVQHNALATIVFNEIVDSTGVKFSPSVNLTEAGNFHYEFDISGYYIRTSGDFVSGPPVNNISFTVSLTDLVDPNSNLDFGSMDIRLDDRYNFESFFGSIQGFSLNVERDIANLDIEYPENAEDVVGIEDAKVILDLNTEIGFGSRFEGYITSYNDSGDSVRVAILGDDGNFFRLPAAPVSFNENNFPYTTERPTQFISDTVIDSLFTIMPTSLIIHSSRVYIEDPESGFGFISQDHGIHGEYTGIIPLTFTILDSTYALINQENTISRISSDNQEIIRKHAENASLTLFVDNHLPISARISIYIHEEPLGDTEQALNEAKLKLEGEDQNGYYLQGNTDTQQFQIEISDFKVFQSDTIYIKFKLFADETGIPITLYATSEDYIRLNGALKMTAKMEQ
jgi:uncharacterized protein YcfL